MNKKLFLLLAALVFSGGIAKAQPLLNGPRNPAEMTVWKSTNVPYATNTPVNLSNSGLIHQVIVSSPSKVDTSSSSVLTLYSSLDGSGDVLARIQLSSNVYTSNEPYRWTFDMYASSGLSVKHSTGDATGDAAGRVQIIYKNGPPQNFKVWSSSFIVTDVATHTVTLGKTLLNKVIVLKAPTGTSLLRLHNSTHSGVGLADKMAEIDLTTKIGEYDMNLLFTRGIQAAISAAGTATGDIMLLFKRNPPADWEYWMPHYSSGTVTTRSLFAGRGIFGGVMNGDVSANSVITVYDSNGTATNPITTLLGDSVYDFDDANFEVSVSSGLTISTSGGGQYTIRYRRLP